MTEGGYDGGEGGGFEERRQRSSGGAGGGGGQRDQPWAHRGYMGNLPFDIEAEDIAAFFRDKVSVCGNVCVIVIMCVFGWLVGGSQ